MRTVLGIAIELFEYNSVWRSSVLFLSFFIMTIVSLQILERPNLMISKSDTSKAVEIIANQIGVTEEPQEKAKSLMERAKDKYQVFKGHKEKPISTKDDISTQIDQNTETPQNQTTTPEPTTLDTLNEL